MATQSWRELSFPVSYVVPFILVASVAACAPKMALRAESAGAVETHHMPGLEPGPGYEEPVPSERTGWAEEAMVVVEAQISVTVDDPALAATEVRALVSRSEGHITRERLHPNRLVSTLTLRVPPDEVERFLDSVGELGRERDRSIDNTDVSWKARDTEVQLDNLRRTMVRYEELLHTATTVEQMLQIEAELTRVRTEIDRLQAKRAFLADRVRLATIDVRLMRDAMDLERQREPVARAWPGLRLSHLMLSTTGERPAHYLGMGFSVLESRSFHLEVDLLSDTGDSGSIDIGLVTIGGEMYSALLGDGRRRFLNPHMGWALGYGWVEGTGNFVGLMTLGVELFRGRHVFVDTGARFGLIAGRGGPSLALQPQVALHVAF